ncbi:hypothetical protein FC40_GL000937 [Ligilactobacillus hayakitensis DSM 18933 = JCM 14209]|uniref:Lreu-0056-like domain-containing protein n=1 Tax=Ligilactobacillus hayakitensis DSM 18933 = JCM 14209 TaxID=1423755 RepID=A0A0R1X0Z3_9LACO|nr:hypothetical protein [Ligilactobacillus hayakitensis]KRM20060.1 hypothetical protein FC40_GL000937 [Ligilactobacillus hayakitensis DSM 18933 = JCM 14209]
MENKFKAGVILLAMTMTLSACSQKQVSFDDLSKKEQASYLKQSSQLEKVDILTATESKKQQATTSSSEEAKTTSRSATSSSSQEVVENLSTQVLGAIIIQEDEYEMSVEPSTMTYGTVEDPYGDAPAIKGYDYLSPGGTGSWNLYFKKIGNQVSIKQKQTGPDVINAEASMKETRVSYQDLINKYYSTPEQKQKIDGIAAQIKPATDVF